MAGTNRQQAADPEGSGRSSRRRSTSSRQPRSRHLVRRIALGIGLAVLVTTLCLGWLAFRGLQVKQNLEAGMNLVPTLQEQVVARDVNASILTLDRLKTHTAEARAAGTDPLWKAAGMLPLVGPNFSAVSEVVVSADDVVTRAVGPMFDQAKTLDWDALTPTDGRVDVKPLQEVAPTLASAANTVQLSHGRLEGIDRSRLLPQVAGPLEDAVKALDDVRAPLNSASRTAQLLPSMMGADGPRTYLVLIQNSAEVRATGGIPGALAVITAEDGRIALTDQGSATEIGKFEPAIEVDAEQEQIYSFRMGAYMQSVNLTPDFPTAAQTAKKMWEQRSDGADIDGVLALDPVVLANLLRATGPVELGQVGRPEIDAFLAGTSLPQELTSENVVPTLLSDVYAQIEEPALQDAYFAAVAGRVFEALAGGQGESDQLVKALATSAEQDRLYLWSNTPAEQDLISKTGIAGAATGPAVGGASFGVYFNDGTAAKMDYYVRRTAQLLRNCTDDGYSQYTVKVTLTNTAPADAAESLPAYVTGTGNSGVPRGHVKTNTFTYGPAQALLQTARVDGKEVSVGSYAHGNRPVGQLITELGPGETVTVEMDYSKVVQSSEAVLKVTPTIQDAADVVLPSETTDSCTGR